MSTRDGVREEEWAKVKEMAIDIANMAGQDRDTKMLENQLHVYLDQLALKYGRLPGIIATKADYTEDPTNL